MIVLMAGEFGISRTRTRDVHCLDIWLLLQFRGVFFFSVESTMPIKIKTAGCCRSIGSMPVARISKWIRPRISTDGDENRAVGRRGGGHVSTISEVVNDVDHDHRSPRIARFP